MTEATGAPWVRMQPGEVWQEEADPANPDVRLEFKWKGQWVLFALPEVDDSGLPINQ